MPESPPLESDATAHAPLGKRVLRAGSWNLFLTVSRRSLGLVQLILVARILTPTDIGLMGVALMLGVVLNTLSDFSFRHALIRVSGDAAAYIDTAWTLMLAQKLAQGAVLALAAPYAASFFAAPELAAIIRLTALGVAISGFSSIGAAMLERHLAFERVFVLDVCGALARFALVVGLALWLRSVWALVWAALIGSAFNVLLSYVVAPHRPRLAFVRRRAAELFDFSRWIYCSNVLFILTEELDDMVVGRLLGVSSLGTYRMSYRIASLPTTELVGAMDAVLFPAYGQIQHDTERIRRGFLASTTITAIAVAPLLGGLLALAPELIPFLLGPKWNDAVPVVQALTVFGALRCFQWLSSPMLTGIGRGALLSRFLLVQLCLFGVLIYPLTLHAGLLGAVAAITVPILVAELLAARAIAKLLAIRATVIVKAFATPFAAAALMVGVLSSLQGLPAHPVVLIAKVALGAGVYAIGLMVLERMADYRVRDTIATVKGWLRS